MSVTFDESDKRFAFITHSECKNLQASAALQNLEKEEKDGMQQIQK
jgi:hypothetical protein